MRFGVLLVAFSLLAACKDEEPIDSDSVAADDTGTPMDGDGDGYPVEEDCDDANAAVFPGAEEVCDNLDNDCDGTPDDDATDAATWYNDGDRDGHGELSASTVSCVQPPDSSALGDDCDDENAEVYPGAAERCDGLDNDCDGQIDDDVQSVWYADADSDNYGDPGSVLEDCDPPEGYVSDDTDCNDGSAEVNPGAAEICNGTDDNCDGTVDTDAVDAPIWYADADADGYGDPDATLASCEEPAGHVTDSADCDDADGAIHPDAEELCDGVDQDCDGIADDGATGAATWYADNDGDGYGDAGTAVDSCTQPSGFIADGTDCDDGDAAVSPAGLELCDGLDNDCDGDIDEPDAADATLWYSDSDGDGYGDPGASTIGCEQPSGFVADATDCDDADNTISPAASEVCDGLDNDCDNLTDDADGSLDASTASTWYADSDADTYGDPNVAALACDRPSGYRARARDCDDADAAINPAASEVCDGLDNDCDNLTDDADDSLDLSTATDWYDDVDADGFGDAASGVTSCASASGQVDNGDDCDDGDAAIHPNASEVCDSADNDCDGTIDGIVYFEHDFDTSISSADMVLNGDASQQFSGSDGYLRLTTASGYVGGTAWIPDQLPADVWYASFNLTIGGGSGADGMTLAWLNSTDTASYGSIGGAMAVWGLSGYAVEFDTYDNGGSTDPGENHVAVINAADGSNFATDATIPELEDTGEHFAEVWFDNGAIEVWLDGTRYITSTISGYSLSNALFGFTAATGGATNVHTVDDVYISCPSP